MRTKTWTSRAGTAIALCALALLCLALPAGAGAAKAKQKPLYWGAWIGPQLTGTQPPWDMSAVARFEQLTGKGLSLIQFAQPFADCGTPPCRFYNFPAGEMNSIRNYGAIPFFSWGSQSTPVPEDVNLPDYQLADVTSGAYDSYIREFAEEARDWGHPFFLRFNWEMNGDWFAWGAGINGNQPGEFVAAWQHVRDIFTSVGATNASWAWCPYADPNRKFGSLAQFYPGDAYVDWTCMDGYNWAGNPTNPHPWRSFDAIFSATYSEIVKRIAPSKPMVIAEIASTGRPRAKAAWIRNMFEMLETKYRRIRALIWFDQIDRGIDWPLETSPAAARAFARGVSKRAFKSNVHTAFATSPIQPPG